MSYAGNAAVGPLATAVSYRLVPFIARVSVAMGENETKHHPYRTGQRTPDIGVCIANMHQPISNMTRSNHEHNGTNGLPISRRGLV